MLLTIPELIADVRANLRCLDAQSAMAEMLATGGTAIDVRESGELSGSPAPRSINIPRGVLEMNIMEVAAEADHPLYLHCATGGRATLAAEQLERLGYSNVTVITCVVERVREAQESMADT